MRYLGLTWLTANKVNMEKEYNPLAHRHCQIEENYRFDSYVSELYVEWHLPFCQEGSFDFHIDIVSTLPRYSRIIRSNFYGTV
jgi:hypothetical protein